MRICTLTLLALVCFASFLGCSRKEAPPSAKPVRVSATKAFETYFGPAPTTDKGSCYAFVIFFPSAKEPGKVVPFPFFSFDEANLKKVALQRLMGGMDEASYAGQFQQPFPKGTRLLSLTEEKGILTVIFSDELEPVAADPGSAAALFNAISLTAMQFGQLTAVRIQSDGHDLYAETRRPPMEAFTVLQPSPPRLLKVTGMKESPTAPIAEVDALFDRPVDIKEFRFALGADGSALAGDVFHSMFDMAAVLKPKDPGQLAEGTKIKVSWKVVDKKGRSAAGEDLIPLEVTVHQD
jgi:germination protein M